MPSDQLNHDIKALLVGQVFVEGVIDGIHFLMGMDNSNFPVPSFRFFHYPILRLHPSRVASSFSHPALAMVQDLLAEP